jgi:hypothetical protein
VSGGGEAPAAGYCPGDEVRLRVTFSTDSNITAVEVVYAHPIYEWITLPLEGTPELVEGTTGRAKRYEVTVSGVVEEHHAPAIYGAARVVLYTFTGRAAAYDRRETGLRGEGYTLPGRWPELSINPDYQEMFDVRVEIDRTGADREV